MRVTFLRRITISFVSFFAIVFSQLLLTTISLFAAPSHSAVLFENQWVGSAASGNCSFECFATPDTIGAENFTLAGSSLVGLVTFDAWVDRSKDISVVSVNWSLWNNSGSLPTGAAISSGTVTPTATNLGIIDGTYDHYQFEVDIVDQSLPAGDYWISFDVDLSSDTYAIYWAGTSDGDALAADSGDGGASWSPGYVGHSTMVFSVRDDAGGPPTPTYTVGGAVSGLTGSVTLQNNGVDDIVKTTNDGFAFTTELIDGANYAVTVSAQPVGQTCSVVSNGSGVISGADVTNVSVTCEDDVVVAGPPPAPATPVPTMSQWALITLAMLLAGIVFVRRKQLS